MDYCVRVFYGGSVRREDGMFEDMKEELELFDEPTSFNDLCVRLNAKFGGDFTLKRRFDSGKTRAHYILMPFRDHEKETLKKRNDIQYNVRDEALPSGL